MNDITAAIWFFAVASVAVLTIGVIVFYYIMDAVKTEIRKAAGYLEDIRDKLESISNDTLDVAKCELHWVNKENK